MPSAAERLGRSGPESETVTPSNGRQTIAIVALLAVAVVAAVALYGVASGSGLPFGGQAGEPTPTSTTSPSASPSPTPTPEPTATSYPEVHTEYDQTTVAVVGGETGEELGTVEAAVADTFSTRYVGLSETDELPADRGMLFVHDEPDEYTYVMRNMSFGIDIVFIAPNGTITVIHEAPEPGPDEDGASQEYSGVGQYVLEVNEGWMADHGVEEGDRLEFDR